MVDLPDYVGQQRRVYGACKLGSDVEPITGGVITAFAGITGMGIVYNALVWVDGSVSRKADYVGIYLDNEYGGWLTWENLIDLGLVTPAGVFLIAEFDDVNHQYSMGLHREINFDTSFWLVYYSVIAGTINVNYHITYALIE